MLCSTRAKLNKHIKEVHNDEMFPCSTCTRTYKTKSNRVKHEKTCVPSSGDDSSDSILSQDSSGGSQMDVGKSGQQEEEWQKALRRSTTLREAFQSGHFSSSTESSAKDWRTDNHLQGHH